MHATALDFELFVSARLGGERGAWLEHHCEACEACAAALAGEAQLEVALRSMTAERRCGMRADAVVEVSAFEREPVRPAAVSRPYFYAAAAAVCVVLAFAAARLPHVALTKPVPAVFADAGDLARLQPDVPEWAGGALSGGTP